MIKNFFKNNLFAFLILAIIAIVAIYTGLEHKPDFDESEHHLQAVQQYVEQMPFFDLQSYHSASGPVPYMIWSVWAKVFGDSLQSLRFLTLLFAFGCVLIFSLLLQGQTLKTKSLVILLALIQPYFIARSLSIYTMVPSLFMGLLTLYAYIKWTDKQTKSWLLLYCIFAVLALLSRQIYLSYILGISAHMFITRSASNKPVFTIDKIAAFGLPFLLFGLLLLHWGGGNPPGFSSNASKGFNFLQLDFAFIFLGFWFWPIVWDKLKATPKWLLIAGALIAVHLLFVTPYISQDAVRLVDNTIAGIIPRIFEIMINKGAPIFIIQILSALLWFMGAVVIYNLLQNLSKPFAWIFGFHLAILLIVPQVWERYYFPVIPVLWLALAGEIKTRRLYMIQILLQAGITVMYVYQKVL